MRKVTEKMLDAFFRHYEIHVGNTSVEDDSIYLFGNRIADNNCDGTITIRDCEWCSATTQERLNGLPNVNLQRKKGSWILNGEPWDGCSKRINVEY